MYKIKKLILWPKNESKKRREIEFQLDKINIIHGHSRTGKTALISCLDYALLSSESKIPVGKIWDLTEWYGILLTNDNEEVLIARRSQSSRSTQSNVFFKVGKNIDIPEIIKEGNINIKNAKDEINKKLNYYQDSMELDESIGYDAKPSFRDSIAFNFQPQTIIASPDTLYYRSNITQYRERLRREFHYFLGILGNDTLLAKIELKELKIKKKRLEKEIEDEKSYTSYMDMKIENLYYKGVSLGIVKHVKDETEKITIEDLKNIISYNREEETYNLGSRNGIDDRIESLEMKKDLLSITLMKYRQFIERANRRKRYLEDSSFDETYQNRIVLLRWLADKLMADSDIFLSYLDNCTDYSRVIESVRKYEQSLAKDQNELHNIEDEIRQINIKFQNTYDEYLKITKQLNALYSIEDELLEQKSIDRKINQFIGEVKSIIELYQQIQESDLKFQLAEISEKILLKKSQINDELISIQERDVSQKLSDIALSIIKTLDADHPNSPINLDIDNLTISINSEDFGRGKDFLYQIGSASNWLSYHISFLLALHKYFSSLDICRVFNFIVFDQPSQVYFPDGKIDEKKNGDLKNTKKIFETLNIFNETEKDVQIIVLEHAGKNIWGKYHNIYEVEEWDQENKLIPKDWYE